MRLVTPAVIELPLPLEASDCPCLQSFCMVHRLVVQWKVNIKAGCAHLLCALETHDCMCASRVPRPPGRHRAAGNNHSAASATPAAAPNASAVVPPPERARSRRAGHLKRGGRNGARREHRVYDSFDRRRVICALHPVDSDRQINDGRRSGWRGQWHRGWCGYCLRTTWRGGGWPCCGG